MTGVAMDPSDVDVCATCNETTSGDVVLLQLGLQVTKFAQAAYEAGLSPCMEPFAGVVRLVQLGAPIALLLIIALLPMAAWAASARGGGLSSVLVGGHAGESGVPPGGGGGAEGHRAAVDCLEDVSAPTAIALSNCLGRFLLSVNFTIVMPSSSEVMLQAGGTLTLSGVAIGAYALGSILGTPASMVLSKTSYRTGLILMGVVTVLGNIAYALGGLFTGNVAIMGLIVARALTGLQAGAQVIFINAVQRTASGAGLAQLTSKANFVGTLGLVIGPACSTLAQAIMPGLPPSVAPSVMMAVLGLFYGLGAAAFFPYQKDLPLLKSDDTAPEGSHEAVARERECWLCLGVQVVITGCRLCQRVAWEAGALTVLQVAYGVSEAHASLLVGIPALVSVPLASQGARLHTLGVGPAMHVLEFMELLGIGMMFGPWTTHKHLAVALFVVGSSLFYAGNWLTVVPLNTLRSGFSLDSHWALNTEAVSGFTSLASFAGQFYGPILARAVLSACTSQNVLAGCNLTLWLGAFIALEPARAVLLRKAAPPKV